MPSPCPVATWLDNDLLPFSEAGPDDFDQAFGVRANIEVDRRAYLVEGIAGERKEFTWR